MGTDTDPIASSRDVAITYRWPSLFLIAFKITVEADTVPDGEGVEAVRSKLAVVEVDSTVVELEVDSTAVELEVDSMLAVVDNILQVVLPRLWLIICLQGWVVLTIGRDLTGCT